MCVYVCVHAHMCVCVVEGDGNYYNIKLNSLGCMCVCWYVHVCVRGEGNMFHVLSQRSKKKKKSIMG